MSSLPPSPPNPQPIQDVLPASPIEVEVFCVLAALAVFAIDHFTPRGIADGLFYGPVILLAVRTGRRAVVARISWLCAVLVGLGFAVSPPGAEFNLAAANRGLTLLAIYLTHLISRGLVPPDVDGNTPGMLIGSDVGG